MESHNMHGGTDRQIIDLFSLNMNNVCIFRLKNPFSYYNGQQYTGTLFNIYNSLSRFDVLQNASIILNGTEYDGNVGLIRKYLHEAYAICNMVEAGMLTPAGHKFIGHNVSNVPLNMLFKNAGTEIVAKLHAFRNSGSSQHKTEIISLLLNLKNRLILIPGDQYTNLKVLCDNAVSEISNINDNPIANYIGEIKNQFIREFGPTVFAPSLTLIRNSITHSLGDPPVVDVLTAASVHTAAGHRLRAHLQLPLPRPLLNNLSAAENIYLIYYNIVETILYTVLNGFNIPIVNIEPAIIAGVDAILTFNGNTPMDNINPFDNDTLSILFDAGIPPAVPTPIGLIRDLFNIPGPPPLGPLGYIFLRELCVNLRAAPPFADTDRLVLFIINLLLNTPPGEHLMTYGADTGAIRTALPPLPPGSVTYSHGPIFDIYNAINSPIITPRDPLMDSLYAIYIVSVLFNYFIKIETLSQNLNQSALQIPPRPAANPLPITIHSTYLHYSDLFEQNGSCSNLAHFYNDAPAPFFIRIPALAMHMHTTNALINHIIDNINIEIYAAYVEKTYGLMDNGGVFIVGAAPPPLVAENIKTTADNLSNVLNAMITFITFIKNENTHRNINSKINDMKKLYDQIINISNNLSTLGHDLQTAETNIVNLNNAINNVVILPPTNLNIYSKEIELLLNQFLVM